MEVKAGYKRTEVGVIPENWDSSTVRGIASRARNAVVGGPFGSDLVSRDYVKHGVPVIRGQNMEGQWVSGSFVFVSSTKAKSLEANLAHSGDIIFTQRGTLGQVSLIPETPFRAYLVSQSQMKLSVNREVADSLFFYYVFTSADQQEMLRGETIQTGVPHINLGILRNLPVQIPPLPEQRAIAEVLSDVDALLGALNQLIAKKRDLKQAAMQQLLTGQTRLPGFSKQWQPRPLGSEVVQLDSGVSVNSIDDEFGYDPYEASILKTSCLKGGVFLRTECKRIAPRDLKRARLNPKANSILISRMNTPELVGECGYVDADYPNLFVPDRLWMTGFKTGSRVSAKWLNYLLSGSVYRELLKSIATGTSGSMKNISKGALLSLPISFPGPPEQIAIAEVLSDMDAELAALARRRDQTRALKQGMMHELLTGRTRLPV